METKTIKNSPLFWLALGAPVILSIISAIFIGCLIQDVYIFSVSDADNFKNFYEIFKIPLGLLTASPLLAGIVSVMHRSEETAKQMKQAEYKNNFDRYMKHKEYINDGLSRLIDLANPSDKSEYRFGIRFETFYSTIFPHNSMTSFNSFSVTDDELHIVFSKYFDIFGDSKSFENSDFLEAMIDVGVYISYKHKGKYRDVGFIMSRHQDKALDFLTELYNHTIRNHGIKSK